MGKSNGKNLTLKEASELSGIAIPTLRMRLKKGLIEGIKNPSKYGEVWYVKANSIKEIQNLERVRLRYKASKEFTPSTPLKEINPWEGEGNSTVEAQKRHIITLEKQLKTYEGLLTDFQARITILESNKAMLENKIKLLPEPIEIIAARLEKKNDRLKKSWWKRLWQR